MFRTRPRQTLESDQRRRGLERQAQAGDVDVLSAYVRQRERTEGKLSGRELSDVLLDVTDPLSALRWSVTDRTGRNAKPYLAGHYLRSIFPQLRELVEDAVKKAGGELRDVSPVTSGVSSSSKGSWAYIWTYFSFPDGEIRCYVRLHPSMRKKDTGAIQHVRLEATARGDVTNDQAHTWMTTFGNAIGRTDWPNTRSDPKIQATFQLWG